MKNIIFLSTLLSFLISCGVKNNEKNEKEEKIEQNPNHHDLIKIYQIGDEWNKDPVNSKNIDQFPETFQRAARATAKIRGGATGFYIGQFNGHHVMATNHHVLPGSEYCLGKKINFTILNKQFECEKFFGHWTDIDLALFAIKVTDEDAIILKDMALEVDFDSSIYARQKLLTLGYGVANNPSRTLVGNMDSDCKVFSDEGDFRTLSDPDNLNAESYAAWSFAFGCDGSHGDSGSAIVDRETGKVIGILWTGKSPKSTNIQNSSYLESILESGGAEIWTELNYAIPTPKIKEFLSNLIQNNDKLAEDTKETIRQIITNDADQTI